MSKLSYIIVSLLCLMTCTSAYTPWNFNGSTPGLKNLILGRCYEYQSMDLAYRSPEFYVIFNCTTFWEKFSRVFAYNDSCTLSFTNAYKDVLSYIGSTKLVTDKAMFWSGTKEVAHDFTHVNNDYYTLEDTFPGYFANNLKWCGCKDCKATEGIDYDYCNSSCDATTIFWNDISRDLATRASGTAYVMLNGTTMARNTAYYRGSIFGRIELPAIGASQHVKKLVVLVVNNVDQKSKEKCGEGTLKELEEDAEKYNISETECIDDPEMVNDVLCAKYPNAHECQKPDNDHDDKEWKHAAIALIAVSGVLLLIVAFLLVMFFRRSLANRGGGFDYKSQTENA